LLLPALVNYK